MKRTNVERLEFAFDADDPEGFRTGMARLGGQLGATDSGATVYELPPGQTICPYHWEAGEEEWLLVLAGSPTLRHPGGTDRLDPGEIVFFPKGPDGAHAVRNDTRETVRVLMFSTVVQPTATVYPDSDKVAIWSGHADADLIVRRESGVEYYDGES